jgi:uncharacterized membrane protein
MKQSRWKSPVLWAAIAAQVLVVLKVTGVWTAIGIPETVVTDTVAALIQLMVLVGVLNDPTTADAW